jgi:hypothetical protein
MQSSHGHSFSQPQGFAESMTSSYERFRLIGGEECYIAGGPCKRIFATSMIDLSTALTQPRPRPAISARARQRGAMAMWNFLRSDEVSRPGLPGPLLVQPVHVMVLMARCS